jgi:hypothetical protein
MFFNSQHLPVPTSEYVAWFDVMGTQATMSRSISAAANVVFKLHIAALESKTTDVSLYPVMDGVYSTSSNQAAFLFFLRDTFKMVADEFASTTENQHRFVIRGGLAFGPVYHGRQLGAQASPVLANYLDYRNQILLGLPMVQAHISEALAPPFGLFIHESARAFAPPNAQPLHGQWWHWKHQNSAQSWADLRPAMESYFAWYEERGEALQYRSDRLARHKEMYKQLCALAG